MQPLPPGLWLMDHFSSVYHAFPKPGFLQYQRKIEARQQAGTVLN